MAICPNCLNDMPDGRVLCDLCEATIARKVAEAAALIAPASAGPETPDVPETPVVPEVVDVTETPVASGAPQFYPEFVAPQPMVVEEEIPFFSVPLTKEQLPAQFKPLGAWAYFGFSLLFAIPVIGWIVLLVFALGGTANLNLRNYARSYFCALLVMLILTGIAVGAVFALGIKLDSLLQYIPWMK